MGAFRQLGRETAQLVIVDLQEKLLPHIAGHEVVVDRAICFARAAAVLGLPITLTEQYPQGLGHTPASVVEAAEHVRLEKSAFSVWREDCCRERLEELGRPQMVVVGIEAHVCVQQTVLDMLNAGMRPVVLADAVGSRREFDRDTSLRRMVEAGADVTTAESAIFEMLDRSGTELFKRILPIVK